MIGIPRRAFLWRALAACGSTLLTSAAAEGSQSAPADRARLASAGYFGDRADAVRAIGEAYLRQLGHSPDREAILAAAAGTLAAVGRARDDRRAIRALERAVRDDFARGRMLQLEGWMLSRTEAEMCALTLLES